MAPLIYGMWLSISLALLHAIQSHILTENGLKYFFSYQRKAHLTTGCDEIIELRKRRVPVAASTTTTLCPLP